TVLRACKSRVPGVPFYYLGDNGRAPYGNLPTYLIRAYTREALDYFATLGVQAVVLACNTVTAVCADEMRRAYPFPIIGVEPAVMPAVRNGGKVGVLTTRATGESQRFLALIEKAKRTYPVSEIVPLPCDGLAKAIEDGIQNPNTDYSPYLPKAELDGVVLGCTHYVFIQKQISTFYHCPTFDGNIGVANRLQTLINGGANVVKTQNLSVFGRTSSIGNHRPVFFLGARNTQNKRIYEQMFAKIRGRVVKNPKKV
ncbi:MAG: aspartate/glutamate racemase family protein, partial [Clostridia bacterium]|nr:aspartate/glutamate racemase family protein [Clostridia bacterium]